MTEGFDKEIDSLLRQTAHGKTAVSPRFAAHLDADEISLFAENSLPVKARMRAVEHLADCAKCRTILANVVILNSEDTSEIVHAEVSPVASADAKTPWYRKMFMVPSLAYAMGGLVVLLAGMIGFVILQNFREPQNSSIAQMEKNTERPRGASGASSDGETATVENYSANAANVATAASPANNAGTISNSSRTPPTVNADSTASSRTATVPPPAAAPPPAAVQTDDKTKDTVTGNDSSDESLIAAAPATRQNSYSVPRNRQMITPDSANAATRQMQELPANGRQSSDLTVVQPAPRSAQVAEAEATAGAARLAEDESKKAESAARKPSASRTVGGKKFTLKDNVWYDAAYNQQKTVNLRRTSGDYRKLDSGLRSIVDNLGGTVIIVWKDKAYRVQ
jgi:hypothetical protein